VIVLIEHETVSGFVVDEARDMVRIGTSDVEPAGHGGGVFAVGRVGERLLLIVDPSLADPRKR
jgi:chemotaxis signal transduction protein